MASRRRGKGRRKVGRKTAPDAQPDSTSQEMTQPIRPQPVKPAHSDSSLVLLDIDGGTRAIRRNDIKVTRTKDFHTRMGGAGMVRGQCRTGNRRQDGGDSVSAWAHRHRPGVAMPLWWLKSRRALGRRATAVFAASRFSIDEILSRPFDRDVPMGCTGDRVWASSPQGWAFRDDVQWLYLTNLRGLRPRAP